MAEELFEGMRAPIGINHPIERVEMIPGDRGVFDVKKDGQLIFSKHELGRKPEHGEVLKLVQR